MCSHDKKKAADQTCLSCPIMQVHGSEASFVMKWWQEQTDNSPGHDEDDDEDDDVDDDDDDDDDNDDADDDKKEEEDDNDDNTVLLLLVMMMIALILSFMLHSMIKWQCKSLLWQRSHSNCKTVRNNSVIQSEYCCSGFPVPAPQDFCLQCQTNWPYHHSQINLDDFWWRKNLVTPTFRMI